jgi:hypothetical protein
MTMPDQPSTIRELLAQMEALQKKTKTWLDALKSKQPSPGANELLGTSSRLLALSRVLLDMAIEANHSAQSIMRQSGKR